MTSKPLTFVRSVWESFRQAKGLDAALFQNMTIKEARPGRVISELTIEPIHLVLCERFNAN